MLNKTGVDLPGEAKTIMHQKDNIGPVELATISFGQSFQITPIQLATTVSSIINGGNRVTPHFKKDWSHETTKEKRILSEETSETMRTLLQGAVEEGRGSKAILLPVRQQHRRHCREASINISQLFWGFLRQKTQRCWCWF